MSESNLILSSPRTSDTFVANSSFVSFPCLIAPFNSTLYTKTSYAGTEYASTLSQKKVSCL
jgi:hypothetical protein